MGGSGGGIIVSNGASINLQHPVVHGSLPDWLTAIIDPILAKDAGTWSREDKILIAYAYTWALTNMP